MQKPAQADRRAARLPAGRRCGRTRDELRAGDRRIRRCRRRDASRVARFRRRPDCAIDPMEAQERWLGLFDRGRSMSLLLFEHIHGESRDRGQAMVDLIETYRKTRFRAGVQGVAGLPAAGAGIPVAAAGRGSRATGCRMSATSSELLAARAPSARARTRCCSRSWWRPREGKVDLDRAAHARGQRGARDDTPEAMDEVWEEEAVRFGNEAPGEDCNAPDPTARRARKRIRTHGDAMNYRQYLLLPDLSRTSRWRCS